MNLLGRFADIAPLGDVLGVLLVRLSHSWSGRHFDLIIWRPLRLLKTLLRRCRRCVRNCRMGLRSTRHLLIKGDVGSRNFSLDKLGVTRQAFA